MPTITVKNIPSDLYDHLKSAAEANRRSINSEIIVCLERALRSQRVNPEVVLTRARQLRESTATHPLDDQEFTTAKRDGRS